MFSLQLAVTLLCLLCFTSAALDLERTAEIKKEVKALQKDKQDIAKKYKSARDLKTKVLEKGLMLVEQMRAMVVEYGIAEEFPPVVEFVEDLKIYLEETMDFTNEQINAYVDEFQDKEDSIKILLLYLLESTP